MVSFWDSFSGFFNSANKEKKTENTQKKLFVYASLIAKEYNQFCRKIPRMRWVEEPNIPLAVNIIRRFGE